MTTLIKGHGNERCWRREVTERGAAAPPKKKASLGQVAATIFFGMLMIGRKGTWHRDGATVTFAQVVVGAFAGLAVVVVVLALLVVFATR
jgi:hypothetical protein